MKNVLTDTVVMISPDAFGYDPATAESNAFQNKPTQSAEETKDLALSEFNTAVDTLRAAGVNVIVCPSNKNEMTPDAVFPNNWFSTHEDGTFVLYPMKAPNRRKERQLEVLQPMLEAAGFEIKNLVDITASENQEKCLEGTGSMVFERDQKVAFAIESVRTHEEIFNEFCKQLGFKPVFFHGYDNQSNPIYHTNVLMGIGDGYVVICLEAISKQEEVAMVTAELKRLDLEIIDISMAQVRQFCGNLLQVKSTSGEKLIVMSAAAEKGFTDEQKSTLTKYGKIVAISIPTIETIGGGSARCMLAEIFLPKQ
ncbi:MAG: citrulline utilization hydrolase CtlX [Weeksellaceae bacterium]